MDRLDTGATGATGATGGTGETGETGCTSMALLMHKMSSRIDGLERAVGVLGSTIGTKQDAVDAKQDAMLSLLTRLVSSVSALGPGPTNGRARVGAKQLTTSPATEQAPPCNDWCTPSPISLSLSSSQSLTPIPAMQVQVRTSGSSNTSSRKNGGRINWSAGGT
jgi:hypothetical protein